MARVRIGRIAHAHGIRGELSVRVTDPQTTVLLHVKELFLEGEQAPRKLVFARTSLKDALIRLEGVDSRTEAEKLTGLEVEVDRSEFPEPEPGEYYFSDLVGLEAQDEAGKSLGRLMGVWETGPVPVLVIGEGPTELLIPYAEPYLVSVDLGARRLVVRVPDFGE
jgi:16S rRNA processing protein RimM